ncbi:MAG: fumarylacetoacetase [Pseudomonadota bacterium]
MQPPIIDETHDPASNSWVASANTVETDFPLQNLPLGAVEAEGHHVCGVAIGDSILNLQAAAESGLLKELPSGLHAACLQPRLNALMALPADESRLLRRKVFALLRDDPANSHLREAIQKHALLPREGAAMVVPAHINGYTDFLTSRHHTERHGKFKGLKDPLPPAFLSLPVAYHGRTSSIRISGQHVIRPNGQYKNTEGQVVFGPVKAMDFELELGAYLRGGNPLGMPLAMDEAQAQIFGYSLLNDWSAKDIQWWEQVLGPFLGKNFHTSVSPWVVTSEALAPFQIAAPLPSADAPPLLPHLDSSHNRRFGGLQVDVEAWIHLHPEGVKDAVRLSRSSVQNLSWTFAQMVAHHTSNGCNILAGDFIGSGTISGESDESRACMTEITEAGKKPVELQDGISRCWLEDGDEIILRAYARREGFKSLGFGECRGTIAPAARHPTTN